MELIEKNDYQKEISNKENEISRLLERDFMFLQAAASHFVCLVYVNIETGRQVRLINKYDDIYEVPVDELWDDYFYNIGSCILDEKMRKRITTIAKFENLKKMKTGEKLEYDYYTNYCSKNGEYYYAHTFMKAVKRNNIPYVVIYTTRNTELEYTRKVADNLADQTNKLNMALNIETQYKQAFLSGTAAVYYINLTKDELELAYYYDDERKPFVMGKAFDLEVPCKYSDYVKAVMSRLNEKEAKKFYDASSGEMIEARIKNNQMYYYYDYEGKSRENEKRWYRKTYLAAKNSENNERYCMITIQDITDIRKMEEDYKNELIKAKDEAEVASRAKSAFLFSISHDIRTPMNAILGFVNLAKKSYDDKEKMLEYLDKVEVAGNHLLKLINDVLSMARVESGKQELDNNPHSIDIHVRELIEMVRPDAEKKQIDLLCDMDIKHNRVYCDSLRLYQVMLNIISNAIKYTPVGGKVIYSVKELESQKEEYVCLKFSVKDTGIGMTKEYVESVFDAFSRAKTSTESGIEGTGLGLAITKQLVELMGGTIFVNSELGVGSEFIVIIELKIAGEECFCDADTEFDFCNFEGRKILLVEDNELNREIAYECLAEWGLIVDTAENGQEAIDKIELNESGYYDAVLMDIQMPVLDGYQATRYIRKMQDAKKANVPIIAMTANAFEEDRQAAIAMGMNEHIAKPIILKDLFELLRNIFNYN